MRIYLLSTILLAFIGLATMGQTTTVKPAAVYQYGPVRLVVSEEPVQLIASGPTAVIDVNDSSQWKPIKYYSIEKLDSENRWVAANRLTASQLVELKFAIDKAIKEEKIETYEKKD